MQKNSTFKGIKIKFCKSSEKRVLHNGKIYQNPKRKLMHESTKRNKQFAQSHMQRKSSVELRFKQRPSYLPFRLFFIDSKLPHLILNSCPTFGVCSSALNHLCLHVTKHEGNLRISINVLMNTQEAKKLILSSERKQYLVI